MSVKKAEHNGKIKFGLNLQTAKHINYMHDRLEAREKAHIEAAVLIGSVLFAVQEKCTYGDFLKWLTGSVCFGQATAYRYIALFNNQGKISGAKNLTQAYKKVDAALKQRKEKEKTAADARVETYKKTGEKPEGWRKNTDDKLAKKKPAGNAKNKPDSGGKKKDDEEAQTNKKQEPEKKEHKKAAQDDRQDTEFNDILADYLGRFANNSRKIIACKNIIKMCRKALDELE